MKTPHEESTYALIVRSEEKERSILEIVVYTLFILSVVAAICQFAFQPVNLQARGLEGGKCPTCLAPVQADGSRI